MRSHEVWDPPTFTMPPWDTEFPVPPKNKVFVAPFEDKEFTVPPLDTVFVVPFENRNFRMTEK